MSNSNNPQTIMLVAGEASGDQHAANMFLALKQGLPEVRGMGMGGAKMREAGINIRFDSSHIGVIGLIEVLKHYREIKQALTLMKQIVSDEKPDLLVCVDYKEFNYKLARHAKQCGVKVLFYVSPQVWAWRPGRVKKYGEVIDMMAVIFPFETRYYEAENVPVRYVGHPSVDKVHPQYSKGQAFKRFNLSSDRPVVGLLPGSRHNEIKRLLPVMLETAEQVSKQFPEVQLLLPQADSVSAELLQPFFDQSSVSVQVIKNQPYDVIQCCDVVLTCSGTATLEIALLGIPMVIAYKLSRITYWLGRLMIRIPFIGLPNIIAGKEVVKEYIQDDANASTLSKELIKILSDSDYLARIRSDLSQVRGQLGEGKGSANMAELAAELLRG